MTIDGAADHGCRCQGCGQYYRVDLNVPDDLWSRIRPEGKAPGAGMLCGRCIMDRVEALGEFGALQAQGGLVEVDWSTVPPKGPGLFFFRWVDSESNYIGENEVRRIDKKHGRPQANKFVEWWPVPAEEPPR